MTSITFKDDIRSFFIDILDRNNGAGNVLKFDWNDNSVEVSIKPEYQNLYDSSKAFRSMFSDAIESIGRDGDYTITYYDEDRMVACITENDYSASAKKMKKSLDVGKMLDELVEVCQQYDSQYVDTAMNACYEFSYGDYQSAESDVDEILQGSDVGKVIALCEDIYGELSHRYNASSKKMKKEHIPDMTERYPEGRRPVADEKQSAMCYRCFKPLTSENIISRHGDKAEVRCDSCGEVYDIWIDDLSKMKKSYNFIIEPLEEYVEHLKAHGTFTVSDETIELLEKAISDLRVGEFMLARLDCVDALDTVIENCSDEEKIIEFIEMFDKVLIGNGFTTREFLQHVTPEEKRRLFEEGSLLSSAKKSKGGKMKNPKSIKKDFTDPLTVKVNGKKFSMYSTNDRNDEIHEYLISIISSDKEGVKRFCNDHYELIGYTWYELMHEYIDKDYDYIVYAIAHCYIDFIWNTCVHGYTYDRDKYFNIVAEWVSGGYDNYRASTKKMKKTQTIDQMGSFNVVAYDDIGQTHDESFDNLNDAENFVTSLKGKGYSLDGGNWIPDWKNNKASIVLGLYGNTDPDVRKSYTPEYHDFRTMLTNMKMTKDNRTVFKRD